LPFQASQNTNLDQITEFIKGAGYSVESYIDGDASLEKFSGDFMNDFDIVFIRTHGAANLKTRGGDLSTILLTGEECTSEKIKTLTEEKQKSIATGGHDGKTYFALSVPWLKNTTDGDFTNSWIYASACESAMVDQGETSLSEACLNLGAAGYNGFDASINTTLATAIAEKMAARFTSGLSFVDASNEVLNDLGLKTKAWLLRVLADDVNDQYIRVELFDYNSKSNDPFYLLNPTLVVGTAKVIPNSGPVGTPVVYEVIINDNFTSQVASIEFDIDNTGEHLVMNKIDTDTWQLDGLTAPTSNIYPRIDTFTFSAYDSEGNILGKGSATFTIIENSTNKSPSKRKYNYL
jgi:hypothetical protein